jgi:hypothetical protein
MIGPSSALPNKDGKAGLPLDNSSPFDKDFRHWIEDSSTAGSGDPGQEFRCGLCEA